MKNNLSRIVTLAIAAIALIGIALFVNVYSIDEADPKALSGAVSTLVGFSFWLLVISVIIAVLLSLWGLIKNPAALKGMLVALGILAVLFFLSYALASGGQVMGTNNSILAPAGSTSKWVSTGLTYSFILGIIGGVLFLYDLIKGLVK